MTHTEREIRVFVLRQEVRNLREREALCRRFKYIASANVLLAKIEEKLALIEELQQLKGKKR